MLKNELTEIERMLFEQGDSDSILMERIDIGPCFERIHQAWELAVFSDTPEMSLVRYFHFHLNKILEVSGSLTELNDFKKHSAVQADLLGLIDHLRRYYLRYFNEEARAPLIYHQRLLNKLSARISYIEQRLRSSKLNSSLISCLLQWFDLINAGAGNIHFTFRSLHYLEYIVDQLYHIDYTSVDAQKSLFGLLVRSNFNSLPFFVYYQDEVRTALEGLSDSRERLDYLLEEKVKVVSSPELKKIAYDPSWPSIKTLIGNWLAEEILLAEKSLCKTSDVVMPKIPLEMSVAHLSCLIRLLYEESVFATQNLQFIFKGFAGYFQSKRRAVISPGSLSKEFYSIDQHTAARVRDLLQRMVQRINRHFFPMVVAINAIVLSYLSMR